MLNSFALSALVAGFMTQHVAAQDELMSFDVYSQNDCGKDESKAFSEKHNTIRTVRTTADDLRCAASYMNWGDWPQDEGMYTAWVDSSGIEDDCQLIFYNSQPKDGDDPNQCFVGYRSIQSDSGCASVAIPTTFGLVYCCGNGDCKPSLPTTSYGKVKKDVQAAPEPKKDIRDVTEAKRAPLLQRFGEAMNLKSKRDGCSFDKSGDVNIKYLQPKQSSAMETCLPTANLDCQISGTYETSTSIGESTTEGSTVTASAAFEGIGTSFGYEMSVTKDITNENSFSRSYTLTIPKGTSGYLIFTAKILCGTGTFSGDDCDDALQVGEKEWCIPALVPGENGTEPDGAFSVFQNN
ncbi:hypothetical protein F4808DRAFT_453897 [Astrocystis sublimbata]|nr:hypothetical protein F4808DRAFT_453897 [Astrocystis sublimbata]